jgi:hypothetical protein
MLEQQRRARWRELHARQQQHLAARDEAARSSRWNVYVALLLPIVLGFAACGWYGLHLYIRTVGRLWPMMMSLLVLMAIDAWLLQRHRNDCLRRWHHHNDAIGAINHALAVL